MEVVQTQSTYPRGDFLPRRCVFLMFLQ